MGLKLIVTGATGMVGEGVLLACLDDPRVERVLVLSRRSCGHTHPKLTEKLVPDFRDLSSVESELSGWDGCLYCAGISSAGMSEADYTVITYDTPVALAEVLAKKNPAMVFVHVSGAGTDGTEKSKTMWARVKGRAENALTKLPFRGVANFRPGLMKPVPGQKHVKTLFRVALVLYPVANLFFPGLELAHVARAMVRCVAEGPPKNVLEVADIRAFGELNPAAKEAAAPPAG